jgi:plastocyanin
MSKEMKRNLVGGTGFVFLLTLFALAWIATPVSSRGQAEPVREIVLEAREVAFGGDNPTLSLRPGERVRFVVRNTDPGVLHSITIPGVDDTVRHVSWGETIRFEVNVPEEGDFEYVCPQHAPEMKGRIVVASAPGEARP